ncbi:MAG: T9SS type A sorting domain-containing protein, partial [Chitinophagaceae bacterium]|nr:T9SS type A sorting domain-containing protein [Chitinophagaceae bacterium]
ENRYRDIAIGSDGLTFYLLTDSTGRTSGPTSGNTNILLNRGSILVYKYTGTTLSLGEPPATSLNIKKLVRLYPNPATTYLNTEVKSNTAKPVYYFIYDVAGRLILKEKSFRDITTIEVSALKAGTYIIKLYDGHMLNIGVQKFIVQ